MEEILQLISNHGIGVVCVGYMIYFQCTTMKEMLKTLGTINTRLTIIEEKMQVGHDKAELGESHESK